VLGGRMTVFQYTNLKDYFPGREMGAPTRLFGGTLCVGERVGHGDHDVSFAAFARVSDTSLFHPRILKCDQEHLG